MLAHDSYTHKLPDNYLKILQKSEIMISLSYGNPSTSLDSVTNARAHILNTQFNIQDGGGDSTLFVDSPVTTVNVFNSIYGTQYKNSNFYELYQVWLSISLKAFPPTIKCLDSFQNDQVELVPQKPIMLFEFSILPAGVQQLIPNISLIKNNNLQTTYIINKSYKNGYYYTLDQQQNEQKQGQFMSQYVKSQTQQLKQYYLPLNMIHINCIYNQNKSSDKQQSKTTSTSQSMSRHNSVQQITQQDQQQTVKSVDTLSKSTICLPEGSIATTPQKQQESQDILQNIESIISKEITLNQKQQDQKEEDIQTVVKFDLSKNQTTYATQFQSPIMHKSQSVDNYSLSNNSTPIQQEQNKNDQNLQMSYCEDKNQQNSFNNQQVNSYQHQDHSSSQYQINQQQTYQQTLQMSTNFLTITIQRNIIHMIHSYFAKMVTYMISLQLSRTVGKIQLLNNQSFLNEEIYKLNTLMQQSIETQETLQNVENLFETLSFEGQKIFTSNFPQKSKKLNDKLKTIQQMVFAPPYCDNNIDIQNDILKQQTFYIQVQPQQIQQQQNYKNSVQISNQKSFLKSVFSLNFISSDNYYKNQIEGTVFPLQINQTARIQKRYNSQAVYQTFIPDVITIPGISLHPGDIEKQMKTLQIDFDGFAFRHRLDVLLVIFSQLPQYLSFLQKHFVESFSNDDDLLSGQFQYNCKKAYNLSSKYISLYMIKMYNIQKILITEYLEDHDIVDIVQEQENDEQQQNYTIILRIIKLGNEDEQQSYICNDNQEIPKLPNEDTLFNEYDYFIAHKAPKHRIDVALLDKAYVYKQLEEKLRLKEFNNQIKFGRNILTRLQYQVQPETLIHLMPQMKGQQLYQQNQQILLVQELFKYKLFCGCFRQIFITFDYLDNKQYDYLIGQSDYDVRINSGQVTVEYSVENMIDKYLTALDMSQQIQVDQINLKQEFNKHIDFEQNQNIQSQNVSYYQINNQNIIIFNKNGFLQCLKYETQNQQNQNKLLIRQTNQTNYNSLYLTINQQFLQQLCKIVEYEKIKQKNLPNCLKQTKSIKLIFNIIKQVIQNSLKENFQLQITYLQYFLANLCYEIFKFKQTKVDIQLKVQDFDVLQLCKNIEQYVQSMKFKNNTIYVFDVNDNNTIQLIEEKQLQIK